MLIYFFFLIAEDAIDTAIDINNLQSEAGSDQPSHISNWWVSAPFHRGTAEKFRGYLCTPPASSCTWPGLWMPPADTTGLAGHTPVQKWRGGRGKHRSDCLPPPCPAAPPAPECLQTALLFLLNDFASSCSSDRHSELHTPGSCSRGDHQKRCCALCNETCSSWHSSLQPAWLSWDFWGCCTLTVLCCLSLLTRNTNTMGLSILLQETESLLLRPAAGSQYITSSAAECTDQKGLTSPLSCSSSHDFTWGWGLLPLQPRYAKVVMHCIPAKLIYQEYRLPGTQFQARLDRSCFAFDYFGSWAKRASNFYPSRMLASCVVLSPSAFIEVSCNSWESFWPFSFFSIEHTLQI